MTSRRDILDRFADPGVVSPLYLPDLTLWFKWHRERDTLPENWRNYTLPEVARALDVPAWTVARPWRVTMPGLQVTTEQNDQERNVRYEAAGRVLTARWTLGPDGDWWQSEYPIKSVDDLAAARTVIEARTYTLDDGELAGLRSAVGEDGVVALEIPMRPYSDILHTILGWSEGLMLFMGEGRTVLLEMLSILEEKLRNLAEEVAALPGDLILAPDNLDGQYVSPRIFRDYFAQSYRRSAEIAHRHDKQLVVHVGGPIRRILPLLAEAGVDGVEGIAGPPQSDISLSEARQVAGPGLTLWGGIPQDLLVDIHSQEEFVEGTREAMRQAQGDGRMILGVADRVPVDADFARLEAIPRILREEM
jgi:hypothetical protein